MTFSDLKAIPLQRLVYFQVYRSFKGSVVTSVKMAAPVKLCESSSSQLNWPQPNFEQPAQKDAG